MSLAYIQSSKEMLFLMYSEVLFRPFVVCSQSQILSSETFNFYDLRYLFYLVIMITGAEILGSPGSSSFLLIIFWPHLLSQSVSVTESDFSVCLYDQTPGTLHWVFASFFSLAESEVLVIAQLTDQWNHHLLVLCRKGNFVTLKIHFWVSPNRHGKDCKGNQEWNADVLKYFQHLK